jgi:hypothetical protein
MSDFISFTKKKHDLSKQVCKEIKREKLYLKYLLRILYTKTMFVHAKFRKKLIVLKTYLCQLLMSFNIERPSFLTYLQDENGHIHMQDPMHFFHMDHKFAYNGLVSG